MTEGEQVGMRRTTLAYGTLQWAVFFAGLIALYPMTVETALNWGIIVLGGGGVLFFALRGVARVLPTGDDDE